MPANGSLQVAPISWDKEANFRLPVQVWTRDDGRLLSQQRLAVLCAAMCSSGFMQYKVQQGIPTWEEAFEDLLAGRSGRGAVDEVRKRWSRLANAVLYEGYMLYPYRASAVKNQQRFNFGVLVPPAYAAAEGGSEACSMRTECLVLGSAESRLEVKVRFLQVIGGGILAGRGGTRSVSLPERNAGLARGANRCGEEFHFPPLDGAVERDGQPAERRTLPGGGAGFEPDARSICTKVSAAGRQSCRSSLVSMHTILAVTGGEFVSLLDPPEELREAAAHAGTSAPGRSWSARRASAT